MSVHMPTNWLNTRTESPAPTMTSSSSSSCLLYTSQASDRAHRIGQHRAVQIHRLVCEGTLEDRIAELLERKRALAESVVGQGEAWLGDLSDSQLAELVRLGAPGDE